jgi:hypothetical protein
MIHLCARGQDSVRVGPVLVSGGGAEVTMIDHKQRTHARYQPTDRNTPETLALSLAPPP